MIANLVHRDFENEIRQFGDVVNTRRPGTFQIRRKQDGTTLQNQDATATNVKVPLDQWFYTSFTIKDGEASKSFQDLVDIYLRPGMMTIARSVDRAVLGRVHGFLGGPTKRVGRLGNLSAEQQQGLRAGGPRAAERQQGPAGRPQPGLGPGERDRAVEERTVHRRPACAATSARRWKAPPWAASSGFDTYMDQNVNSVSVGNCDVDATGTVTNALAAARRGSQAVTLADYAVNVGEFVVVAGNDQPTYITAATAGPAPPRPSP